MILNSETTIYLNNGSYFNFLEPDESVFSIYDIANALSKCGRFSNQGDNFYSVAEHSVYVSHLVPEEDAMEALMHDASEFVMNDVATPLKRLLPEYKRIEEKVEESIFKRFGLRYPFPPSVKIADKQAFYAEKEQVINNFDDMEYLQGIEKPKITLMFYDHMRAKTFFLNRYFELKRKAAA